MFAVAEGRLPVAREELGDGAAGFGFDHIVHVDESASQGVRRRSGPTVVLPEPMKPVRTMRRDWQRLGDDGMWTQFDANEPFPRFCEALFSIGTSVQVECR